MGLNGFFAGAADGHFEVMYLPNCCVELLKENITSTDCEKIDSINKSENKPNAV